MSFYTDVIQQDPRFHSTECIRDLELLEPGMRAAVAKFDAIAKTLGHELVVTETYRSPARQLQLYQKKLTELKNSSSVSLGFAVCAWAEIEWLNRQTETTRASETNRIERRIEFPQKTFREPKGIHYARCSWQPAAGEN